MSDLDTIRMKVADRPIFYRETTEQPTTGNTYFKLDHENVATSPAPIVRLNGTIKTVTTHYTVDYANGSITFVSAPTLGDDLIFEYYATVWTDAELQSFLTEAGNSTTLASAHVLYAWAADAARLAFKESRSGGGGLGSITMDTSVRAREMRLTADALMKQYDQFEGTGENYEGITEVAWTGSMRGRMVSNWYLDNDSS